MAKYYALVGLSYRRGCYQLPLRISLLTKYCQKVPKRIWTIADNLALHKLADEARFWGVQLNENTT